MYVSTLLLVCKFYVYSTQNVGFPVYFQVFQLILIFFPSHFELIPTLDYEFQYITLDIIN